MTSNTKIWTLSQFIFPLFYIMGFKFSQVILYFVKQSRIYVDEFSELYCKIILFYCISFLSMLKSENVSYVTCKTFMKSLTHIVRFYFFNITNFYIVYSSLFIYNVTQSLQTKEKLRQKMPVWEECDNLLYKLYLNYNFEH